MFVDFSKRLKELRELKGYSQRELAKLAGISDGYPGLLEKGTIPSYEIALKIAKALSVDISYFQEEKNEPQPLLKYANHFPEEVKEFLLNEEKISWLTLAKDFDEKGLSPEDFKEIADLILKHKLSK